MRNEKLRSQQGVKWEIKCENNFIADTQSTLVTDWFYTFVFGGCFDAYINFRIFISHFIPCQFALSYSAFYTSRNITEQNTGLTGDQERRTSL